MFGPLRFLKIKKIFSPSNILEKNYDNLPTHSKVFVYMEFLKIGEFGFNSITL